MTFHLQRLHTDLSDRYEDQGEVYTTTNKKDIVGGKMGPSRAYSREGHYAMTPYARAANLEGLQ